MTRQAVSKHLRVLERAGLVAAEARGRNRLYRLQPGPLRAVDAWVGRYRLFWAARLVDLKHHVESGTERDVDDAAAADPSRSEQET